MRCLSEHIAMMLGHVSAANLFKEPPVAEFRPSATQCAECGGNLTVQKTRTRTVSTLHVGRFLAHETFMTCKKCNHTYRSEELCSLVPPGANFGYDVISYVGKALFLRHRNGAEVVAELARMNIQISLREVSLLGMKFVTYLALAHQRRAQDIMNDMQSRGGYICHLDATCEGGNPLLMSSLDSLSGFVLSNVKIPSESEAHIVPFLEQTKENFGIPVAMMHDMSRGIIKAVETVFPGVPDFICHFHFLRDIGNDYLGVEYKVIRDRLKKHGISKALLYRAKQLKRDFEGNTAVLKTLAASIESGELPAEIFKSLPAIGGYTLIQWALNGKTSGNGYGFPFDRPHLSFAQRLRCLDTETTRTHETYLTGYWKDNGPYSEILIALAPLMKDKVLWRAVESLEEKIIVFDKLRKEMRIALQSGRDGLNDIGDDCSTKTIEKRVKKFRAWLIKRKDYAQDKDSQKMIKQIDKYWDKLFADPITVQTAAGPIKIQPQRTNNILEQFFRSLKRVDRRKTGNASSRPMLRTILAETPLVQNLNNPSYMKILLNGKASLEEVFAEIEIEVLRKALKEAKNFPERIPSELKPLIAMRDFPAKLVAMIGRITA